MRLHLDEVDLDPRAYERHPEHGSEHSPHHAQFRIGLAERREVGLDLRMRGVIDLTRTLFEKIRNGQKRQQPPLVAVTARMNIKIHVLNPGIHCALEPFALNFCVTTSTAIRIDRAAHHVDKHLYCHLKHHLIRLS